MNRLSLALAVLLAALGLAPTGAAAQSWPAKPIRIMVPFAAGGAVDALARLIGMKLSEQLGQPVVVENRAGAGGNLAPDVVAKAPPAAYTLLLTTHPPPTRPPLYSPLPF